MMVFDSSLTFPFKITDGTAQTMCFAEHYYYCKKNEEDLDFHYVFQTQERQRVGGGTRRATFADAGCFDVVPVTTNGVSAPSQPGWTFQYRPKVEDAWGRVLQTPHAAGLPVAMFDGSVRTLSPSIAESVFWGLITPNGGEVIGDY